MSANQSNTIGRYVDVGVTVNLARWVQQGGTRTQNGSTVREVVQADDGTRATGDIIPGVAIGHKDASVVGAATGAGSRAIDIQYKGRCFVVVGAAAAIDPAVTQYVTCDANGEAIASVLGTHQDLGVVMSPLTVAVGDLLEVELITDRAYAS